MSDQRRRRCADVVQMLCKCFVFAGVAHTNSQCSCRAKLYHSFSVIHLVDFTRELRFFITIFWNMTQQETYFYDTIIWSMITFFAWIFLIFKCFWTVNSLLNGHYSFFSDSLTEAKCRKWTDIFWRSKLYISNDVFTQFKLCREIQPKISLS